MRFPEVMNWHPANILNHLRRQSAGLKNKIHKIQKLGKTSNAWGKCEACITYEKSNSANKYTLSMVLGSSHMSFLHLKEDFLKIKCLVEGKYVSSNPFAVDDFCKLTRSAQTINSFWILSSLPFLNSASVRR